MLESEKDIEWQIYTGKPWIHFDEHVVRMRKADIVLGIFGVTRKTQMVIPNKVYEGLAVGKPVITADTPAIRELLADRENVLLCEAGDPHGLADKIRELRDNLLLREQIGKRGHEFFRSELTPVKIVSSLIVNLSR